MNGISSAINNQAGADFLAITVADKQVTVSFVPRPLAITDDNLLAWSGELLKTFYTLEVAVKQAQSITLTPAVCTASLKQLAEYGALAYREFFDETARQWLAKFLMMGLHTPTFIGEKTIFPWELLHEGSDDEVARGAPEPFWGLRYRPARIFKAEDVSKFDIEQSQQSNMLFCVHDKLREAHQHELPALRQLIDAHNQQRFSVLGPASGITDDKTLLKLLDKPAHNMIHFACHCEQGAAGADALLVSLISDSNEPNPPLITLKTNSFTLSSGKFALQPLVFLNACDSGGGGDVLRVAFNLPKKFAERGAGAVIATVCPVPDRFAAAFARVFYGFFLYGRERRDPQTGQTTVERLTIGEALRETRWYFLNEHHNPLGLAYGLYSSGYYRLAQAPQG